MTTVGAWPVAYAPYGRRGGVARPLGPVWPPWKLACRLAPVWPPLGRGSSFGSRILAFGAWPVPWAPYGRRGGVARPLGPVWPPWVCGPSLGPVLPPWLRGPSPELHIAALGALPVPWALYGRRGGVASPLGPALPP